MADGAPDVTLIIDAVMSEASRLNLSKDVTKSITDAVRKSAQATANVAQPVVNASKKAGRAIIDLGDVVAATGKRSAAVLKSLGKESADAGAVIKSQVEQITRQNERLHSQSVSNRLAVDAEFRRGEALKVDLSKKTAEASIRDLQSTFKVQTALIKSVTSERQNEAQKEIVSSRNAGKIAAIEAQRSAQLQVVSARDAGKQRLQIQRALIENLGRLEKGLAAIITGVAKTTVSAISKAFAGLSGIVHRQNKEFTEGLGGSLKTRESEIKSSFLRQETIISRSAQRQAAELTALRAKTQTGVLGGVNKLTLGGIGFAVGIAAFVKSTFTLGSEFVRGLAVLQAQLGLTAEQMKSVRQLSLDLGNDITLPGVSALDAAQAIQILTKQFGFLGPAAVDAAKAAAKGTLQLSRAVGATAEDSAAIIGASVNVFGIAADQAVGIADQIAGALSKAAGVSFTDFKDSFTQAASVFASFQVPAIGAKDALLEFNTALATLAKGGLTGESAGAALKQFFISASKNSKTVQKDLKGIAQNAGVSGSVFFDTAGKARRMSDSLDILRKGLKGLTQEQRTQTLTTIFGSRAIQAANLLVGSSAADYIALRDSINQQGLAAKIAAAQNTGFKGALDALGSVIDTIKIQLFEIINGPLGKFTLGIATFVNEVISGGGAFAVLRTALKGIAIGMAAIIAVKGAVEVIKLLGVAAKLALTPFGALLVIAGAVGAAIAILSKRSAPFREAMKSIVDRLGGLATRVKDAVLPALQKLGQFFTTTILPAIERVATFVGTHLVGAFDAVVRFITSKVIPTFKALAGFIQEKVFPVFADVGRSIAHGFTVALDAVRGFFTAIKPLVQPAIDAFSKLAGGIRAAFGGDFSKLGGGFAAVGAGLLASLGNIASKVVEVLTPVGKAIFGFFKKLFTIDNVEKAFSGFLVVVETLGKILGSIVSDPRFLKAVATIVGAAVIVGFRFVKGFAEGVLHNIPKLFDGAAALIAKALFNPRIIGLAILAALTFSTVIRPVLQRLSGAFGDAGTQAGGTFGRKFVGGLGSVIRKAGGSAAGEAGTTAGGFFSRNFGLAAIRGWKAMFQGPDGFTAIATRNAKLAAAATRREFNAANNLLTAGGQPRISQGSRTFAPTTAALEAQQLAIAKLRDGLGEAGFRALALQTQLNAVRNVAVGSVRAIAGFGTNLAFASEVGIKGFAGLKKAFSLTLGEMRSVAATSGVTIGQAFGAGLKGAASAAVVAIGGFLAGRAEGKNGGNGLLTAALSGLTTTLLTGNVALGLVAGGASLLGTVFGQAARRAEEFKKKVGDITSAIKSGLKDALETGTAGVVTLKDALATGEVRDQLEGLFSAKAKKALLSLGITMTDITKAFNTGSGAVQELVAKTQRGTGGRGRGSGIAGFDAGTTLELADSFKALGLAVDGVNLDTAFRNEPALATKASHLKKSMRDAGKSVTEINDALDKIGAGTFKIPVPETGPTVTEIDKVAVALELVKTNKEKADAALLTPLPIPGTTAFTQAVNSAILDVQGLATNLSEIQNNPDITINAKAALTAQGLEPLQTAIREVVSAGVKEGIVVDANTARFVSQSTLTEALAGVSTPEAKAAINAAFEGILTAIVPQIDTAVAADNAFKAATEINRGFAAGLNDSAHFPRDAATAVADKVIGATRTAFGIRSPSKVFADLGSNVGQALADGLAKEGASVSSAASGAVQTAIDAAMATADKGKAGLRQAISGIFGSLTGSNAINIGGGTAGGINSAVGGITQALQGFRSSFDSSQQQVSDVRNNPFPGTLTAAQRAIAGSSVTSLNATDVIGQGNLSSLTSAFDAIATLGDTLLAQGTPVAQVTTQLGLYVDQLNALAASLGFNQTEVATLADSLGLSSGALADFANQAKTASGAFVGAGDPNAAAAKVVPTQINNITNYLPFGDPEAVALATANRLALQARF